MGEGVRESALRRALASLFEHHRLPFSTFGFKMVGELLSTGLGQTTTTATPYPSDSPGHQIREGPRISRFSVSERDPDRLLASWSAIHSTGVLPRFSAVASSAT